MYGSTFKLKRIYSPHNLRRLLPFESSQSCCGVNPRKRSAFQLPWGSHLAPDGLANAKRLDVSTPNWDAVQVLRWDEPAFHATFQGLRYSLVNN